jgi:hypothetical protein
MEKMAVSTAVGAGAQSQLPSEQWGSAAAVADGKDGGMANRSDDMPPGSAIVVTNPNEDCSPEAFHAFLDDLVAGPEPELESLGAAEALRELRVDVEA